MHEDIEGPQDIQELEDFEDAEKDERPVVLVVADSADTGVDAVIQAIAQRDDVCVHRVDPNDIGTTTFLVGQIVGNMMSFCVLNEQGRTYCDRIRSVWWRPPSDCSEGWGTLEALLHACPHVYWIGSPQRINALSSPPRNILAAARAGFETPMIELHPNPGAALFEVTGRWGAVRTLSWGGYPFGTGGGLDDLMMAPAVVFQQRLKNATHRVTVFYIDGQMFAARAELADSPLRYESEELRMPDPLEAFFDIPEPIAASVTRFCETFGGGSFICLRYAVFHLLVSTSDQWWFDTVEPLGDFWPVEEATKQPISRAFANLLATGETEPT
ncbi:hypothetical protein ACIA78_34795 [Streptomyces xanthochromogenes]|uniref:hypothetical protein n=1 Tax=Streptomyces xanthochromogenes TaxID=67384 RepID=UPI0037A773AE